MSFDYISNKLGNNLVDSLYTRDINYGKNPEPDYPHFDLTNFPFSAVKGTLLPSGRPFVAIHYQQADDTSKAVTELFFQRFSNEKTNWVSTTNTTPLFDTGAINEERLSILKALLEGKQVIKTFEYKTSKGEPATTIYPTVEIRPSEYMYFV